MGFAPFASASTLAMHAAAGPRDAAARLSQRLIGAAHAEKCTEMQAIIGMSGMMPGCILRASDRLWGSIATCVGAVVCGSHSRPECVGRIEAQL